MADEPNFMFPEGFPEEAKEAIIAQHRREMMSKEADAHQLYGFISGLSVDDTRSLRAILRAAQNDSHVAAYYDGVLSILLAQKEELCWACGKNHDADLSSLLDDATQPVPTPDSTPEPKQALVDAPNGEVAVVEFTTDQVLEDASRYGVEFIGPVGPNCPVKCVGCGLKSISLADRMLRSPDDCHGCIEKAKWG